MCVLTIFEASSDILNLKFFRERVLGDRAYRPCFRRCIRIWSFSVRLLAHLFVIESLLFLSHKVGLRLICCSLLFAHLSTNFVYLFELNDFKYSMGIAVQFELNDFNHFMGVAVHFVS